MTTRETIERYFLHFFEEDSLPEYAEDINYLVIEYDAYVAGAVSRGMGYMVFERWLDEGWPRDNDALFVFLRARGK